jgi:hypothetical protein
VNLRQTNARRIAISKVALSPQARSHRKTI